MTVKKWLLSLVFALTASALFGSVVLAGKEVSRRPKDVPLKERSAERKGIRGEITGVDVRVGTFSLQTPEGAALTIRIDENTRFRGQVAELADLEPGMRAGAVLKSEGDERPLALLVLVPELRRPLARFVGMVADVDVVSDEFTLQTRAGEELTFTVEEATVFRGAADNLSELAPGMHAVVAARAAEGGTLPAVWVGSAKPRPAHRIAGEVASVDPAASRFELDTRQGERVEVVVDEKTQFRSRKGDIPGIVDLEAGMLVIVGGRRTDHGIQARVVLVEPRPERPSVIRVRGEVTEVGETSFGLLAGDGRALDVKVDADTRFRSRGGQVQDLSDLTPGTTVLVAARKAEGDFLAKIVLVPGT